MTQARTAGPERHGGRLSDARVLFPDAPRPWLDLSTGINPRAWDPSGLPPVNAAALPDPAGLRALEAAAAAHFGARTDMVAAVPGSEAALRMLPHLGLARPLTALRPCYGTHAEVADTVVRDPSAAGAGTLLLANPNNPDGRVLDAAALHEEAAARAAHGGWLVVDEAFADADPDTSLVPGLTGRTPVVVLRSFGKFFGLAGVRLGFVVAAPPVIARVRALTGDWPVSAHALAWGTATYADRNWIADARRRLRAAAARLDALLAGRGLTATGNCPLFRLVEHAHAGALFERLAAAGIWTRPFADRRDWLRFGLPPDDAGFARLERALG